MDNSRYIGDRLESTSAEYTAAENIKAVDYGRTRMLIHKKYRLSMLYGLYTMPTLEEWLREAELLGGAGGYKELLKIIEIIIKTDIIKKKYCNG